MNSYKKIIAGLSVLAVAIGIGAINFVSAISMPGSTLGAGSVVRNYTNGAVDPVAINVGTNTPANPPNAAAKPIPTFSTIDSPVITSTTGPVQVADDLIVHGVIDARNGMISGAAGNNIDFFGPTRFRSTNLKPGDLTIDGSIASSGIILNILGNVQLPTGDLQVLGWTNLKDLTVNGPSYFVGETELQKVIFNGETTMSANTNFDESSTTIFRGTLDATGEVHIQANAAPFLVDRVSDFQNDVSIDGKLTVTNGDIAAPNANFTAKKIGTYYRVSKDNQSVAAGAFQDIYVQCGAGDTMTSIQGHAGITNPPKVTYIGSYFSNSINDQGYATFKNTDVVGRGVWVQGICFNPDGGAITGNNGTITKF